MRKFLRFTRFIASCALIAALSLASAAIAELPDVALMETPQTPAQQALCAISAQQSAQVAANLLATRKIELEPGHESGLYDDALRDFVASIETGLPEPTSILLLIPTERFGAGGALAENGFDDPAVQASLAMGLPLSVNYSANLERDQALYLECMSAAGPVEAWPGVGVAYALRFYGDGKPQCITAITLSGDSAAAAARTTLVCFRQIATRPDEVLRRALSWFGMDAFEIVKIKG